MKSIGSFGNILLIAIVLISARNPTLGASIYIAPRTDGIAGDGSKENPLDASSFDKYDAIINARVNSSFTNYDTIYHMPGTYSRSNCYGATLSANTKLLAAPGAAPGSVTVLLHTNSTAFNSASYMIFALQGASETRVAGLTLDCQAQFRTNTTAEIVYPFNSVVITCGPGIIEHCVSQNNRGYRANECFPLGIDQGIDCGGAVGGGIIRNCIVRSLRASFGETTTDWLTKPGVSAYVTCFLTTCGGTNSAAAPSGIENCLVECGDIEPHAAFSTYGINSFIRGNRIDGFARYAVYMDTGGATNIVISGNSFRAYFAVHLATGSAGYPRYKDIVVQNNSLVVAPTYSGRTGGWRGFLMHSAGPNNTSYPVEKVSVLNNDMTWPDRGPSTVNVSFVVVNKSPSADISNKGFTIAGNTGPSDVGFDRKDGEAWLAYNNYGGSSDVPLNLVANLPGRLLCLAFTNSGGSSTLNAVDGTIPSASTGTFFTNGVHLHGVNITGGFLSSYLGYPTSDGTTKVKLDTGTISMWFKPTWGTTNVGGGTGPGTWGRLFEVSHGEPPYNSSSSDFVFYALMTPDGSQLAFGRLENNTPASIGTSWATVAWAPNSWHHVAVSYTPTSCKLFVDGQLVASGTSASTFASPPLYASETLYIGSRVNGADPSLGTFDQIETFAEALTENEVLDLYRKFAL